MDANYLSENILILDGKTYYQDKLIKNHNWHTRLDELGWTKLSKHWIKKLNKLHTSYPNNSLFGVLECGNDGDCLFHCISYALNTFSSKVYDSKYIRNIIAESITPDQFSNIISCYRCMKDFDDFDENWDPYEIDTIDKFKDQVCKSDNSYWGDHLLLQLLVDSFSINVLLLTQNEYTDIYEVYNTAIPYNKNNDTIILVHENNSHFKLLGYFNNIMNSYFTHTSLPIEIKRLFNLQ